MLLGIRKNALLERLDKKPNLDFIQNYVGGSLGIIELPNGIDMMYDEEGVYGEGVEPSLILKYSNRDGFDYGKDRVIFGDCLFVAHDELGSSEQLNITQTSFLISRLYRADNLKRVSESDTYITDNEIITTKLLDLRLSDGI